MHSTWVEKKNNPYVCFTFILFAVENSLGRRHQTITGSRWVSFPLFLFFTVSQITFNHIMHTTQHVLTNYSRTFLGYSNDIQFLFESKWNGTCVWCMFVCEKYYPMGNLPKKMDNTILSYRRENDLSYEHTKISILLLWVGNYFLMAVPAGKTARLLIVIASIMI